MMNRDTPHCCLHILVRLLCLAISMWMVSRRGTGRCAHSLAELAPDPRSESWFAIGQNITGNTMELDNIN